MNWNYTETSRVFRKFDAQTFDGEYARARGQQTVNKSFSTETSRFKKSKLHQMLMPLIMLARLLVPGEGQSDVSGHI